MHTLFDDLQFRVLRERLFATVAAAEPEAEEGFDVAVTRLGVDEVSNGWTSTPATVRGSVWAFAVSGVAAPATLTGVALAAADGAAAYLDPASSSPATTPRWRRGWPTRPCPRRRTTSRVRCSRCAQHGWRSAGVTSDTSSPPICCAPISAPSTWPTSPCATCTASCAATIDRVRPAHPRRWARRVRRRAGRGRDAAGDAPSRDLADAFDAALDERRRDAAARRAGAAADIRPGGHGGGRHRRRHRRVARPAGRARRGREGGRAGRARSWSAASSISARPSSCRRSCSTSSSCPKTKRIKTGYTTDADSLADLYVKTEHPLLELLLRHREVARLKTVVDGLLPLVDDAGPHPHHVQPDRRRDRPAVVDRPEPAEHPGAHRGGPTHPRGVHRRRRVRVADDRRLQPDRDADHGAPVRATPG